MRKSLSHGLQFQAAYTFSRAFTNETYTTATPPGPGYANSGDPLNFGQQYGLNPQSCPQRLVISYNWEIPAGHVSGLLGKLVSYGMESVGPHHDSGRAGAEHFR